MKTRQPARKWKRALRFFVASVILGFVAAVATAWIPAAIGYEISARKPVAMLLDPDDGDYYGSHEKCRFFELCTHEALPQPSILPQEMHRSRRKMMEDAIRQRAARSPAAVPPGWSRVRLTMSTPDGEVRAKQVRVFGFGWPRVCLRGYLLTPPSGVNKPLQYIEFWRLPESANYYHNLPAGVIWAGMGYNTAVFSVPLFVMGWGAGATRRWRRRRRGACQRCGYSLVGNVGGACPECGNPLASISNQTNT